MFIYSKQDWTRWNDLQETRLEDTLEDEVYIRNEDSLYIKDIYAKGQVDGVIFVPGFICG